MKIFTLLVCICSTYLFSQSIDYNIKKGFAVNGYDVVSYFSNQSKEGENKFISEFNNIKYKFSSKENLDLFEKHPEKYLPQYGGYCAYAIAEKADKVSINPKTFQVKDGKLYLFYNAWGTNTLELWQKENKDKLQKKADENWEKIKFKK